MKKIRQHLLALVNGHAVLKLSDPAFSPRFYVANRMERRKILESHNEKELLEIFLEEIQPGDTVFDIGANIGLYTLPSAMKVKETGAVHAFEPAPPWLERLLENLRLNGFENVEVYGVALSDRNETGDFSMKGTPGSGMGSIVETYDKHIGAGRVEKIQVPVVHGGGFLEQQHIPVPNIVKIDVEGAELPVLRGLEKSLKHPICRFVLCEVHPDFMTEPHSKVKELLEQYGFTCRCTGRQGDNYHIFAHRG